MPEHADQPGAAAGSADDPAMAEAATSVFPRVEEEPVAGGDEPATGAPADPQERSSKAGRNVPIAIGVGVGMGLVILASLFLYRPSFVFVVAAAVLYGCFELSRAVSSGGARVALTPLLVGSVAILAAAWWRGAGGLVVALLLTICGIAVWRIADTADSFLRDFSASAFCALYLPALAGFAILLVHPHDGAARVVAFISVNVCSDTGGFATGVLFGRHPLAPVVSKAKTWEGLIGSVFFCVVAGVLFFTLTFHEAWWKGALFGLAITVAATLGDLGESMIKRDLGIKDMGNLLPGHGGIMDRLDSLLIAAPVAFLVLSAFAR